MNQAAGGEPSVYDVTIIGGGPAGLYAAFYAGMRDLSVKILEGGDKLGGFLHTYAEKRIWDVGGLPPIRCALLVEHLVRQAATFDPTIQCRTRVDGLTRRADGLLELRTDSGALHLSRTVIIAVGRGIAEPHRLELDGAQLYELTNLHYTVTDPTRYRDKRVLVSGGGNSAVDWALELAELGARVTVVHRQSAFRAMERNVALMHERADVRTPCRLARLHGAGARIAQVTIEQLDSGRSETLEVDEVVVFHGYSASGLVMAQWGLESEEGILRVNARTATAVPGVFAAGDCASYPSKVRLIAGAFNDAILAVNSAKQYLDPNAAGMAYVSSHNEVFRSRNPDIAGG
ncbi:NAD(P)/FAD-dependent oxidoreductase [Paenibacillus sp. IB182496]|uniref:Ferredoxin--NADP reductase n=1 Tax=Paenibacillus sabuli TaxID=2772509 RepID=A0A927BTK0_9BACL|nr:NAD(P)/FAD-dependent oxidoreductase [Paenibacillus sabuli]MBD2846536.1 NAD(P)/FAD-dependent oxidoreductase [Paenibacillus sabuli]